MNVALHEMLRGQGRDCGCHPQQEERSGGAALVEGGTLGLPPERGVATDRHGYSLLELLVYVAVFAIGLNLFVSLLGSGARLSATTSLSLARMEGVREVENTFTRYTRRAAAVIPEVGEYKTGAHRLVLKMPPGQEEGFEYLVLGKLQDVDRFAVLGLASRGGAMEIVYLKTLRQPLEVLDFEVDGASARPLVSLRVQVKAEDDERKQRFLENLSRATPRGMGG